MTTIYYNPETGESYGFGPGQKPPKDWKKLQDIPPHPDWDLIGSGGCVLYDPGKEPRLFVDVETGKAIWMKWPVLFEGGRLKPLIPLPSMPPNTTEGGRYFNPATGESYNFKDDQTAPPGWEKMKPIPPHPDWDLISRGGCTYYEPGKEPKLFIDPETGDMQWLKFPYRMLTTKLIPVVDLLIEPPLTTNDREYFNPATGESYNFGPRQTPPKEWKKLNAIPLPPNWDIIGRGGCALYNPGTEPKLFIDPKTGDSVWVAWPYAFPEGWQPYTPLLSSPFGTSNKNEFFNPDTGEAFNFGEDQTPPKNWEKLKGIPLPPNWDIIGGGGCVWYEPGKEPKLFVDPKTGEGMWVHGPLYAAPVGWLPFTELSTAPPMTGSKNHFFNPENGDSFLFAGDETPPANWKVVKPLPPHPDRDLIAAGGCPMYPPGREPKIFINPENGETIWSKWPYHDVTDGWVPLQLLEASPNQINYILNALPAGSFSQSGADKNPLLSDPVRLAGLFLTGSSPITEWATWNPVRNPLIWFIKDTIDAMKEARSTTLWKRFFIRMAEGNLNSVCGTVRNHYGRVFEVLANGNLRANYPALDLLADGKVGQIKAFLTIDKKSIAQTIKNAAEAIDDLYKFGISAAKAEQFFFSPAMFGNFLKMVYVVPTGTAAALPGMPSSNVIDEIFRATRRTFKNLKLQAEVQVIQGIPGKFGKLLRGLSFVGGVLSAYQLKQDIENGDVASGVGSAAGTASFALEMGAIAFGSTTAAVGAALTGSFAVGYGAGTLINEHVLADETKGLIGQTLYEFENMSLRDIWNYYAK